MAAQSSYSELLLEHLDGFERKADLDGRPARTEVLLPRALAMCTRMRQFDLSGDFFESFLSQDDSGAERRLNTRELNAMDTLWRLCYDCRTHCESLISRRCEELAKRRPSLRSRLEEDRDFDLSASALLAFSETAAEFEAAAAASAVQVPASDYSKEEEEESGGKKRCCFRWTDFLLYLLATGRLLADFDDDRRKTTQEAKGSDEKEKKKKKRKAAAPPLPYERGPGLSGNEEKKRSSLRREIKRRNLKRLFETAAKSAVAAFSEKRLLEGMSPDGKKRGWQGVVDFEREGLRAGLSFAEWFRVKSSEEE